MSTYSTHSDLQALWATLNNLLGSLSVPAFLGTGTLNDLTTNSTFLGSTDLHYKVQIDGTGPPNTFKWSENDGSTWKEGVAITGDEQMLSHGVTITFGITDSHIVGDAWTFLATAPSSDAERAYAYDWLNDALRAVYTVPISSPSQTVILAEASYALFLILNAHDNPAYLNFQSQANNLVGILLSSQLRESKKGGLPLSNTVNAQAEFSSGRYNADGRLIGSRGSLDDW